MFLDFFIAKHVRGVRRGETIEWIWIGTHNEFDNLFS